MDSLVGHIDRAFLASIAGPAPATKKAHQAEIIASTAAILPALMERFQINTALRIAHFLAQIAHESDSFCTTEEYASGAAYEGRDDLGNVKSGDGKRFKGHGLIQVTGRSNHRNFRLWLDGYSGPPDFEAVPSMAAEFPWAVWGAIWFWTVKSCNVLADRDDLIGITRIVNGGSNGLGQRREKLARAKAAIARVSAEAVSIAQRDFPVLHRGSGLVDQVACLQRLLAKAGYYHLAIDGDFGAGTEGAVRAFQARRGLTVDGLAGEKTFSALLVLLNLRRGGDPWTLA